MSEGQPAAVPPKRGSSVTLVVAILLLTAAAGGGAFWWARRGTPAAAAAETRAVERGIVSFEPFVVNLADADAPRFLRASIQLVVDSAAGAEKVQKTPVTVMQARSAILEVLTVQTSDVLVTPDGKARLKKLIGERVATILGEVKVQDVLFSDFVIQF